MFTKFYYGKTGSGKTLHAVIDAFIANARGRQIFGNLHLKNIPYTYVEVMDLITEIDKPALTTRIPKTLILDEIHTLFDSRNSATFLNKYLSYFVSQCRKRNFDIIYTSQYASGADTRLRQLTDKIIRCVPTKNYSDVGLSYDRDNPEPTYFNYFSFDIESGLSNRYSISRHIARYFYQFYMTEEVIVPAMVK